MLFSFICGETVAAQAEVKLQSVQKNFTGTTVDMRTVVMKAHRCWLLLIIKRFLRRLIDLFERNILGCRHDLASFKFSRKTSRPIG